MGNFVLIWKLEQTSPLTCLMQFAAGRVEAGGGWHYGGDSLGLLPCQDLPLPLLLLPPQPGQDGVRVVGGELLQEIFGQQLLLRLAHLLSVGQNEKAGEEGEENNCERVHLVLYS